MACRAALVKRRNLTSGSPSKAAALGGVRVEERHLARNRASRRREAVVVRDG